MNWRIDLIMINSRFILFIFTSFYINCYSLHWHLSSTRTTIKWSYKHWSSHIIQTKLCIQFYFLIWFDFFFRLHKIKLINSCLFSDVFYLFHYGNPRDFIFFFFRFFVYHIATDQQQHKRACYFLINWEWEIETQISRKKIVFLMAFKNNKCFQSIKILFRSSIVPANFLSQDRDVLDDVVECYSLEFSLRKKARNIHIDIIFFQFVDYFRALVSSKGLLLFCWKFSWIFSVSSIDRYDKKNGTKKKQ